MVKILQKENKILRKIAEKVPREKIGTPELRKIIRDMKTAIHKEKDAVAIAAPQIGVSLRIFVVSGFVFAEVEKDEDGTIRYNKPIPEDMVFINPEIIKKSREQNEVEEGCLSARWWYGNVKRAKKTTVRALDKNGQEFTRGGSGLLAQIFQHETDHLNGGLFTDKAKNLRKLSGEEIENLKKSRPATESEAQEA